ncbi:MAG: hypothetical protein KGD64_13215 [Candidatus Heimdallarchaeota archaeon]|nr:hypothetical protein [Candidatus Heimdallarchaeota archaeon]
MKITKKSIALAITIILCFSLNQTAVNSLSDTTQQDVNSLVAEEQQIKEFPGGVLINFDEKADSDPIGSSYPELEFSPGYRVWNSSDSIYYPPESGENVALSQDVNNWFTFEIPIQKVGLFVSTAIDDYNLVFTAYTNQNVAIEEIYITPNTINQYIEFDSPLGRIYNISASGTTGFNWHWTIDTLSYLEFSSPTPNLIDFEDLTPPTLVDGNYAGLSFTPGFTVWNSYGSSTYPPHSGNNVIYTYELVPNITFSFPVESVSLYINVASDYDMQVLAYSESGILLQKAYAPANTVNEYVTLRSLLGMIHRITFIGDPGFNMYWSMDDLCYVEYTPNENQLLTFDELAESTHIDSLYAGVTFSPDYITWNSTGNANYPPQSGDLVIYSNELVNNITFDIPKAYVSFYINTVSDYDIQVEAYNVDDVLIQTFDVDPSAKNQLVELYSAGGFINRISISGSANFENYWSIDTLYFEEFEETFEFLLDFEDYPSNLLDLYPHVTFSTGFESWNSYGSISYPPSSGDYVAYSHDLKPNITFTIPIMYTCFYISSPTDYSIDVLGYSSDDKLIYKVSIEPDSIDKFVEIYSEDSEISRITLTGTVGFNSHWTIENLYYMADIYTYDLDGDGLSYHEEIAEGTDPLDWDSDNDGFSDGEEIAEGTDPNDPLDYPILVPEFGYLSLILFVPFIVVLGLLFRRRR